MHEITLYVLRDEAESPVSHTYHYPSSWAEVSGDQLMRIIEAQSTNGSDTGARYDLLRDLAGIPAELMQHIPASDLIMEVDVTDRSGPWKPVEKTEWQLLPSLDWAFKKPCYEKSFISTITHKGQLYVGPDDRLDHMTLNQWVYCTTLLNAFRAAPEDKAKEALNTFLGALYQPYPTAIAVDMPAAERNTLLNEHRVDHWSFEAIETFAEQLADLDTQTKLAAATNYEALHATLAIQYWRVFDPNGEVMDSPQGLFSIVHDAASSVAFADMKNAEKQLLHKVLGYTEHNLHKDQKAAEEAKKKK